MHLQCFFLISYYLFLLRFGILTEFDVLDRYVDGEEFYYCIEYVLVSVLVGIFEWIGI